MPQINEKLLNFIKYFIRQWLLAPKMLEIAKKMALHNGNPEEPKEQYGFFPVPSFEHAKTISKGWQDPQLVTELLAGYKRMMETLNTGTELTDQFMELATAFFAAYLQLLPKLSPNQKVSVLDYGGACAEYYFRFKTHIPQLLLDWTVLETEAAVNEFKEENSHDVRWMANSELAATQTFDICVLSGVLQCIENPSALLKQWSQKAAFLVINFIPIIQSDEDRASVRRCKWAFGDASYPLWFFSEKQFHKEILKIGEIIFSWKLPDAPPPPGLFFWALKFPIMECC